MPRLITYYLLIVPLCWVPLLAFPVSLWASPGIVSSNIEQDFERSLDADSSMVLAEEDRFDELFAKVALNSRQLASIQSIPESELRSESDAGNNMSHSVGWSELLVYEEIREERQEMYRVAERHSRKQVVAVPRIPEQGSSLAGGESNIAGNVNRVFIFLSTSRSIVAEHARNHGNRIFSSRSVVNLAQRDYFSFRNGYSGRSRTVLLKNSRPLRLLAVSCHSRLRHPLFSISVFPSAALIHSFDAFESFGLSNSFSDSVFRIPV